MRTLLLFMFVCFGLGFGLSGCGIKPSSVEPPEGSIQRPFPATYPNPSTLDAESVE